MATLVQSSWLAKGVLRVAFSNITGSGSSAGAGIGGVADVPGMSDKTITTAVSGAFGSATLWSVQGSNATSPTVSTVWFPSSTPTGADLTGLVSGVGHTILENPRYIRVIGSGSTGTSLFGAVMMCYAVPR